MEERRRFGDSERVALYVAADGKCSNCGKELEPGWHADHMTPYAHGGQTDVINGQALCPSCNLKKGGKVSELRVWQEEALARFLRNSDDFLTVATPGAGKTRFALIAAMRLIERDEIEKIIVVVPSAHLRKQWAKAAAALGVQLDHRFENGAGVIASDFDGVVVTYNAVANAGFLWRKIASKHRTLVILDEIHHAGDDDKRTWGPAIKTAFAVAARRLLLSGTPFRSDGAPIPFVKYDDDKRCTPDYDYDYGKALADGGVVRPIQFPALDGDMTWRTAGQVIKSKLSETDDKTARHAMLAAYDADGSWIRSALRQADGELSRHRETVADAGGLVLAPDVEAARRYADILHGIRHGHDKCTGCGEEPVVAVNDDPDASARISAFAESSARWIVAVQMVSEGVDIPRLEVGIYASRVKTEMFFRQVVGRFVRMRGPEDEACATLFIPSVAVWLEYAERIERTVDRVLKEARDDLRDEVKSEPGTQVNLVEVVDSSDAELYATIHGGESFPDAELKRADDLGKAAGLPSNVTAAQLARVLRLAGTGRVLGTVTVPAPAPAKPLADVKHKLRQIIKTKVGRLAYKHGIGHREIHLRLNQACGEKSIDEATVETLNRRLDRLDEWLEQE